MINDVKTEVVQLLHDPRGVVKVCILLRVKLQMYNEYATVLGMNTVSK